MEILIALIVLLGLPAGFILARMTKEELKAGKIYFQIMQSIIYDLVILSVAYYYLPNLWIFSVFALIIIFLSINLSPRATLTYLMFVPLFILSQADISLFVLTSAFMFLYGLPTGALMMERGFVDYMKEEIEKPISAGYLSKIFQKIKYIIWVTMLEIISTPSYFMKKKRHALYHLKFVCPLCPSGRRRHRDVKGGSACWWENNWLKGNYKIPKHFGIKNWIKQYLGFGTNLKKFKNLK